MKPYYDDGKGIQIYLGDCREILPQLPSPDLVLTDPPYPNGVGYFNDGIESAKCFLSNTDCPHVMSFWSEIEIPPCKLRLCAVHIWHRTNVNGKIYEPCYEFCQDGRRRRSSLFRGAAIFDGAGAGCCEYLGHPTQKPLHVIRQLCELAGNWHTALDPFMGSGTTLRIAKDLGRKAIGIEIEERYCELAARRLQQEVLDLKFA